MTNGFICGNKLPVVLSEKERRNRARRAVVQVAVCANCKDERNYHLSKEGITGMVMLFFPKRN